VADTLADRLRGLLATDLYTEKGRLRSDDLLVRERVSHELGAATATVRQLISRWRAERVPPSTREQPFPPAAAMEPIRQGERLVRAIEDTAASIRGLPLLSQDKVWDRVRRTGLDELMQFDWTMVGEAMALSEGLQSVAALDEVDVAAQEARLRTLRQLMTDRQRYIEIS
jgi:hypothetical protein